MASFFKWSEKSVVIQSGLNVINLDPSSNIFKLINENAVGTILYMSTKDSVNQNLYEEKIDKGAQSSIVRVRPLNTIYIFNPSPDSVTVTGIEIETDDISFIFNATNQISITGEIDTNGLRAVDLKFDTDRTLHVYDKKIYDGLALIHNTIAACATDQSIARTNQLLNQMVTLLQDIKTNTTKTP